MTGPTTPGDELLARMLRRRATRGDLADLEGRVRSALAGASRDDGYRTRVRWLFGAGRPAQAWYAAGVATGLVVAIVGIAALGRQGSPGGVAVSPSASSQSAAVPTPAPVDPSPFPWPSTDGHGPQLPGIYEPDFWPALRFELPEGWRIPSMSDGFLEFVPDTPANGEAAEAGSTPVTFVDVFRNMSIAAADCRMEVDPSVGNTATEIIGAIATRPGLAASEPKVVEVGGFAGLSVDFALEARWDGSCADVGTPFVPLLYQEGFVWYGVAPGERFRIIVLDVAGIPDGMFATLMVLIYTVEESGWEDHLDASMSILDSFEFDTSPTCPTCGEGGS